MREDHHGSAVSRREVLRALGAGATAMALPITTAALAAQTAPAGKATGRKFKLGIFTSVYAGLPLDEAARRIKADGFSGVVFDYAFKDVRFDPFAPDWDIARKITAGLEREGIAVAGLYGYYNVIDPDAARRKRGRERMELLIKNWKRLGSPIIATETGTYNAQSEFMDSPQNYSEEAYVACRAVFAELAKAAEKTGAIVAIEPYWRNVIDSVERAERLFKDVSSPALKLVMDPCNYFRNDDVPRMKPMLEEIFRRVGKQTVLAHAKDVKAAPNGPEHPAAGLGQLDYPLYLRLLAQHHQDTWLVLEHLGLPDVPRARDYVKKHMESM